jgi:hypothetical protein
MKGSNRSRLRDRSDLRVISVGHLDSYHAHPAEKIADWPGIALSHMCLVELFQ